MLVAMFVVNFGAANEPLDFPRHHVLRFVRGVDSKDAALRQHGKDGAARRGNGISENDWAFGAALDRFTDHDIQFLMAKLVLRRALDRCGIVRLEIVHREVAHSSGEFGWFDVSRFESDFSDADRAVGEPGDDGILRG